jgi:hypothetical protein
MYSFQKKSQIPDECYSCPELIQCFKEPKDWFFKEQKGIVHSFSIFPFNLRDATKFNSDFSVSAWLYKKS